MANASGNLFLVGPMGSGKTTIGTRLARRLGKQFIDCDQELERRTGVAVSLIFDIEGEEGFRERESRLLDELTLRENILLATGGGVVKAEQNRAMLMERGFVVYLNTTVEQQLERLSRDKQRPLLQAPDRRQRLMALAEEREPLYREVADLIIDSEPRSVRQMAARVLRQLDAALGERAG